MSTLTASTESVPIGYVPRYSFHERICHWVSAITYTYCLATGLAFYTPHLFWIALVLGGGPTSRFWHPIVGVGFFVAILWMHGIWRGDMGISSVDRAWLNNVKYYATNRDDLVPVQGRFNAGQKLFYWAMLFGAVLLLLSGLAMWFPEAIPFGWHWGLETLILIHEAAALITIGAFIIHVYMGVFLVPNGFNGMLFGYVPAWWAKLHHRLWYNHVVGERSGNE
jgi:formate dehydrogenase subunit gamma